jgi:2-oxo-4-hydroxy-4-carboxy-5-ureidoimidazoline decarboxylase
VSLADFNALSDADAQQVLARCLAVPGWTAQVAAGRPYADERAAVAEAEGAAATLTEGEVASALARHPRIGEQSSLGGDEAELSRREQSGVDPADEALAQKLREGNAAYEAKFDRVFLIRAAGRSDSEILGELERRLDNSPEAEHAEVVGQLREIAVLRLREALAS